jgi:hypothetical protein
MPAPCPQCGRPLAAGARRCVYCAQGTQFKPREQLNVPKGATAYRKVGFPWGKLALLLVAAVGIGYAFTKPQVRAWLKGLVDQVKSFF